MEGAIFVREPLKNLRTTWVILACQSLQLWFVWPLYSLLQLTETFGTEELPYWKSHTYRELETNRWFKGSWLSARIIHFVLTFGCTLQIRDEELNKTVPIVSSYSLTAFEVRSRAGDEACTPYSPAHNLLVNKAFLDLRIRISNVSPPVSPTACCNVTASCRSRKLLLEYDIIYYYWIYTVANPIFRCMPSFSLTFRMHACSLMVS